MPIQLVIVRDRRFVALILPDPGRRTLRFLFRHAGQFRAMCWMTIGSDGSLYLNPRQDGTSPVMHGQGIADGAGGFTALKWTEPPSSGVQNRKVSYHASGRVKGGARMSKSISVRDIEQSMLIRQDEYAHSTRFEAIQPDAMRTRDFVIPGPDAEPYELDEDHPLTSRVFAAPLRAGNALVPMIDDDPTHERVKQRSSYRPST